MRTGHVTLRFKHEADSIKGMEVICQECLKSTFIKTLNCGFEDAFGGVSDWQSVTECCESNEWRKGCDTCGEKQELTVYEDMFLCKECYNRATEKGDDKDG